MKRVKLVLIFSIFVLLLIYVAVVYKSRNTSQVNQGDPDPEVTPTSQLIQISGYPENFPKDFPRYGKGTLTDVWSAARGGVEGLSLILTTEEATSSVYTFYKTELTNKGWAFSEKVEGDSYILSFEKEKFSGFIAITSESGEKTVISVTMGIE